MNSFFLQNNPRTEETYFLRTIFTPSAGMCWLMGVVWKVAHRGLAL
jgi:hypothetical protein